MSKIVATSTRIATEARRWIGTPYRHGASVCHVGCDCLGLIRGVYRALGGDEAGPVPIYRADWAAHSRDEILLRGLARYLTRISVAASTAGDVLVFRLRDRLPASHAGIRTGPDTIVHAWERGPVAELSLSAPWRRRAVCAYRFVKVMD